MAILAIDFDEVVHAKSLPIKGRRMGAPVEGAKEALDRLANVGHTIIIFTVMAVTENGKQAVKDWLDYYDIMYHEVTAIKPNADVFLDDKAIRFINWEQALADIQNLW